MREDRDSRKQFALEMLPSVSVMKNISCVWNSQTGTIVLYSEVKILVMLLTVSVIYRRSM